MQTKLDSNLLIDPDNRSKREKQLPELFFLLAIIFGLILIFLEPPFSIPDENAHFINICRISNGSLFGI